MRRELRKLQSLVLLTTMIACTGFTAWVVSPRFHLRQAGCSRTVFAQTDVSNLESAIEAFRTDTGRFPTTKEGLEALASPPGSVPNWHGPYIKRGVPADPWGDAYVYYCPDRFGERDFELFSSGPDGIEGNADDVRGLQNSAPSQ